jgi:putative hydrolase of the HAD superfamily
LRVRQPSVNSVTQVTKSFPDSDAGSALAAHGIKFIFFDAAGTLFHLPRGVGWHYRDVALRHGWDLREEELRRAFGSVWQEMPARAASRAPRKDDDKGWWRELVERVLDRCAVASDRGACDAYFEELYREFTRPGVWELFPEVREALAGLQPRFRLGVISNFDGRLRLILDHLGISGLFHPVVISSEVGADKPDAWIFEQALTQAGVAPGEALHVGDDPERDWQGAHAAGLRVFRLSRPGNSLRDLQAYLTSPSAS